MLMGARCYDIERVVITDRQKKRPAVPSLPNRSNSRAMLSVAHHSLGEPGESVEAKRSRTEPAGKRVAQACDRLLEPALRA